MKFERKRVCHPSGGPQMTKLSEQASTDVNLIMDSWISGGQAVAGHLNTAEGRYGDFSSGIDFQSALNAVSAAQDEFRKLPAKVRAHVNNDPGAFLDMVYDPSRRDELEGLGLVDAPKPVEGDRGVPGDDVPGDVKKDESPEKVGVVKKDPSGDLPPGDPGAELFD